jgi:toxin ParE1/3/4
MHFSIKFFPEAVQDLIEIFTFVALNDSIAKAERLVNSLESVCQKLEIFPERGHVPQEFLSLGIDKYLEIHFKPYRIFYEIDNNSVYILTILDGRRNIQEILISRLIRN